MRQQIQRRIRFRQAAVLGALLVAGIALASPSNKWRIEVSGGADSEGTILLNVVPEGQVAVVVTVQVPKGTSENRVANLIREALKARVGDRYATEVDDGEDVLVKKRRGSPMVELSLAGNTVDGVRLRFDRE